MDGRSLRDDEWHTINVTKPTSEVFEDLQARKLNQSQIQTVSLQPKSLTNPRVTTTLAKVLPGQNSGTKKQREKLLDGESRYQIEKLIVAFTKNFILGCLEPLAQGKKGGNVEARIKIQHNERKMFQVLK